MSDLNNVSLIGRLTRDPEIKTTSNGKIYTDLKVACNRIYNNGNNERTEESNFFTVVFWGRQAEIAGEFLKKGQRVAVEGRLHQFQFPTPQGDNINVVQIVGRQFHFLELSSKNKKKVEKESKKNELETNTEENDKEVALPI